MPFLQPTAHTHLHTRASLWGCGSAPAPHQHASGAGCGPVDGSTHTAHIQHMPAHTAAGYRAARHVRGAHKQDPFATTPTQLAVTLPTPLYATNHATSVQLWRGDLPKSLHMTEPRVLTVFAQVQHTRPAGCLTLGAVLSRLSGRPSLPPYAPGERPPPATPRAPAPAMEGIACQAAWLPAAAP